MFKRVMVAVVGIPFLLVVFLWAPEWATMLLLAAMCGVGAWELMHAVAGETGRRLTLLTVLVAGLIPLDIYLSRPLPVSLDGTLQQLGDSILGLYDTMSGMDMRPALPSFLAPMAFVFLFMLFLHTIRHYGKEGAVPFADLTAAIFAGLVFPLMLSCLLRLRLAPVGRAMVFIPLAISFGSDTFAYFAGMLCGRHKLAPRVSPKKTVEGAVGGLLGGVIGMALFQLLAGMFAGMSLEWFLVAALGALGSFVSQIGDLSFSVIKREFGVKDYGNLLPGHGGILDRFDSVTFVAPFVWFIFSFL